MKTDINLLKKRIQKELKFLKDAYKVKSIGVFGSMARGDYNQFSDIDILVEFSEPISMFRFIDLEEYLEKITDRKVDLVTKKALKPAISREILQEVVYV